MKKLIFILIAIFSIIAIPVNAQVCFAQYRTVVDEYGEIVQQTEDEIYCPTRIELNVETQKLTIKTKKHGTAVYTVSSTDEVEEGKYMLLDANGEVFGMFIFYDNGKFGMLTIKQKNNVLKNYIAKEYLDK